MSEYDRADGYEDDPPQSSLAAPLLRALLFAALAFGIYALLFGDLGGEDDLTAVQTTAPVVADITPAGPTEPPPPLEVLPSATPTDPGATPGPAVSPGATDAAPATGQIGNGITVQVIAGADTTAAQFDSAVQALTEMGYAVTEDGISGNAYPRTTVFPTAGEEAAAQALVDADPRFAVVGENPGNLTDQLQIHVLVGEDWPT